MTTTSIAYRKTHWALLIIVFLQTPAHARPSDSSRAPVSIGVSYQQMVPGGEFRENIRGAPRLSQGALGFDLIFHLRSAVNLRLDYFFGMYDKNPCNGWCDHYSFRGGGVAGELVLPRGLARISHEWWEAMVGAEKFLSVGALVRVEMVQSGEIEAGKLRKRAGGPESLFLSTPRPAKDRSRVRSGRVQQRRAAQAW